MSRSRQETRGAVRVAREIADEVKPSRGRGLLNSAFPLALGSSLLLWAAFPPPNLWPLAWLAPIGWILLIRAEQLPGKRPYLAIWIAGCIHWLLMLQGIRLAHVALYGGWLALSLYVAVYVPLFVGLARVAVHRLRVSVVLAAPVVWVGLELIRGYLLTGFSLSLISHTQVRWTALLQISDTFGAYGVSFVILLVAACLGRMMPLPSALARIKADRDGWTFWPAIPAVAAACLTLSYGYFRLTETVPGTDENGIRVALIQGSLDTVFDATEAEYTARIDRTFSHYGELTQSAAAGGEPLDLVVWPESMFAVAELLDDDAQPSPASGLSVEQFRQHLEESRKPFERILSEATASLNPAVGNVNANNGQTHFLFGSTTFFYDATSLKTYNSALLASPEGKIVGRYYKMHPVMFGEYIPLADRIPWLYTITPLSGGLTRGDGPKVFEIGGIKLAPNICFESTVPHLLRRQVTQLDREGKPPDVLVNITNDGWFKGSSILDMHLRCSIFRAIENRKPTIIAANTGFSAWIDGNGRVVKQGPRRAAQVLVADVRRDGRAAPYHTLGDVPAILCGIVCCGLLLVGARNRWRREAAGGAQVPKTAPLQ